jgi:hypothetical protein
MKDSPGTHAQKLINQYKKAELYLEKLATNVPKFNTLRKLVRLELDI